MATLFRALVLTVFAAGLGLAVNAARPGGLRFSSYEAPASCDQAEAAGEPLEVAPDEAARLCGASDVVIADARPASRFAEGHVAGAIHLPCDASGPVASDAMAHLDGKHTIIVYGDSTADAQPVAASLRRRYHGVRVSVLRGGFTGWSAAGLACASGPCDECSAGASRTTTSNGTGTAESRR